jgi:hypothetical protein
MGTGLNGRSGLRLAKELLWIQGLEHAHCAAGIAGLRNESMGVQRTPLVAPNCPLRARYGP